MDKTIFMELLHAREFKAVRSILNVMNAVDIAALMTELEDKELAQAFRLIPKSKAADVFAEMNSSMQSYLVSGRYGRLIGRPPGKPCHKDPGKCGQ